MTTPNGIEDPELKNLLRENARLENENNRMIRYIYRSTKWSSVFSVVKWIVIVAATIGLFYYLKPVIDSLATSYQTITGHQMPNFSSFFISK